MLKDDMYTDSHCFTPFCVNAVSKFTLLPHLRPLIFGLMLFGWLCTSMLLRVCTVRGTEQNWEALHALQTTSVTLYIPFI